MNKLIESKSMQPDKLGRYFIISISIILPQTRVSGGIRYSVSTSLGRMKLSYLMYNVL